MLSTPKGRTNEQSYREMVEVLLLFCKERTISVTNTAEERKEIFGESFER